MEINDKKHVVTTRDELLNHIGWHECIKSRYKLKGHGNRIFRTFELDCGNDYHLSLSIHEAIGVSLGSLKCSKPYVTASFRTLYGKCSPRMTEIKDCTDRSEFYWQLYNALAKRFPLTDLDVQETKVWY